MAFFRLTTMKTSNLTQFIVLFGWSDLLRLLSWFSSVLQVKTLCWNLYQRICQRQNIPLKLEERETGQQLLHIKRTIKELEKIVCSARLHASKEVASNVATPSNTEK
jgi:hypothetical protein